MTSVTGIRSLPKVFGRIRRGGLAFAFELEGVSPGGAGVRVLSSWFIALAPVKTDVTAMVSQRSG